MKILLLGASKTGTTAITYAIHEALSDHEVIFEPASLEQINSSIPKFIAKYLNVRDLPGIKKYQDKFDKKILIVRHPLDRLISLLLYTPYNTIGFSNDSVALKYLELLKQKTNQPDSQSVLEIIDFLNQINGRNIINGFKRQYQDMIKLTSSDLDFFVLKYEDFIDSNLQALSEYLNIKMNQAEVEVPQQYQRVNRTKGYDDWKNWLTLSDLKQLQRDFSEICETLQYDLSLSEDYSKVIEPQKSYQYTQSVINEFRQNHFLPEVKEDYMMIKDEGVLFDRAFANFKSGNLSEAKSLIDQSIALNPNIPGFYILLAKILIKENQLETASVAISKAIELAPEIEAKLPKKFLKIKSQVVN
jgi:tetratricopeptide (TPR) repeat protein